MLGGEKIQENNEDILARALQWEENVHRLAKDKKIAAKVIEALNMGDKGFDEFKAICVDAKIEPDQIEKLWESLIKIHIQFPDRDVGPKMIW